MPEYLSFLKHKEPIIRIVFYTLWLTFNLLQAGFTNLIYDEAYYWVCAREIDWGHFYSPPFIDVLIRGGYALFQSELGIRFLFTLISTAGIYLLEKLLLRKDLLLYYAMMASLVILKVIGILAAPDIPLFFLTITFYILFRRHLAQESLLTTLLLAINSALLLYTKYHGVLVIAFTFLANFRTLFRRWTSYLWIILAVLVFIPHILWQVRNGFPTIVFHLFERPGVSPFELRNILDYISGQLLFAGPFISIILFIALFRVKPEDRFERTLFFNLLAMYAFFFLISFYHQIEMNWTVIGIPPLIILSHKVISERQTLQRWTYPLVIPSVILAMLFRIILIFPEILPVKRLQNELSGHAEWAGAIKEAGKGRPIVFTTIYQTASIYAFYSGDEKTYTLNPNQKSDFDFFGYEEELQGQDVYLVSSWRLNQSDDSIPTNKQTMYGTPIDNFRSYKRMKLMVSDTKRSASRDTLRSFHLRWENPYPYDVTFLENPEIPSFLSYRLFKDGVLLQQNGEIIPAEDIPFDGSRKYSLLVEEEGDYELQFFLQTGSVPPHPVSRIIKFEQ